MNVLEIPLSCEFTKSKYDDSTCVTVVSTTVQDRRVYDHHILENGIQHPVDVNSKVVIKTLNVLVNDRSIVGAYAINLIMSS